MTARARSRGGQPAAIEEFVTDGGIAVVHRALGDDLHGLELTEASFGGGLLLRSTVRGDVNLRHLDGRRALIVVRDLETGMSTDVTWGALPSPWRAALDARRGNVELRPADGDGIAHGDPRAVIYDRDGNPVLAGLVEGGHYLVTLGVQSTLFVRGDANADGGMDIGDAVWVLGYLFSGAGDPECRKALDSDDSGQVDIGDAIYLLAYLFAAGSPPAAPFAECAADPTEDSLTCLRFSPCR